MQNKFEVFLSNKILNACVLFSSLFCNNNSKCFAVSLIFFSLPPVQWSLVLFSLWSTARVGGRLFDATDYLPFPETDDEGTLRGTNALRLAKVVLFTQLGPAVAYLHPCRQRDRASWSTKRLGGILGWERMGWNGDGWDGVGTVKWTASSLHLRGGPGILKTCVIYNVGCWPWNAGSCRRSMLFATLRLNAIRA